MALWSLLFLGAACRASSPGRISLDDFVERGPWGCFDAMAAGLHTARAMFYRQAVEANRISVLGRVRSAFLMRKPNGLSLIRLGPGGDTCGLFFFEGSRSSNT